MSLSIVYNHALILSKFSQNYQVKKNQTHMLGKS